MNWFLVYEKTEKNIASNMNNEVLKYLSMEII